MEFYLASSNPHKVDEISKLAGRFATIHSAAAIGGMPAVEETGETFLENARLKAQALVDRLPAGGWALADDSGLEVDALAGAPGVYSARFAGVDASDEDNNAKLIRELEGVTPPGRKARFVCTLVALRADDEEHFRGICDGTIAESGSGTSGFGYDPYFIPEGYDRTFGELGSTVKGAISHRARALEGFRRWLQTLPN